MIWYPPYYEDPDPEEEAEEAAEYAQVILKGIAEAATKYPGYTIKAHLPSEKGGHKRGISESTPRIEREVEGERGRAAPATLYSAERGDSEVPRIEREVEGDGGRAAPATPNGAERGDSEVPNVSRYGRQRRAKQHGEASGGEKLTDNRKLGVAGTSADATVYSRNYRTTPSPVAEIVFAGKCKHCRGSYTASSKKTAHCRKCVWVGFADQNSDAFANKKLGLTEYTHDDIRRFLDSQMPQGEPTTQLREHAKVYVLADKYLVHSLKALAIHKLHRDLVMYDMKSYGVGELVELIRYTYTNTRGVDDADGTDNELRELVATYAVSKAPEILKEKDFREMLEEGGDAAFEFAYFLAKRLT